MFAKLNKITMAFGLLMAGSFLVVLALLLVAQDREMMDWGGVEKVLAKLGMEPSGNYLVEAKYGEAVAGDETLAEGQNETEAEVIPEAKQAVESQDARAKIVANFIERNDAGKNSPLQPYDEYGQLFVEVADEFGLDFRLLPVIARKESTFCKSNIGRTYYNCFGYGVPSSGITEAGKFTSYEEGFRTVAGSLKRNYIDKGLTDPVAIMGKYCPACVEAGGTWAANINQWLAEMRYDDKAAGIEKKEARTDLLEFTEAGPESEGED